MTRKTLFFFFLALYGYSAQAQQRFDIVISEIMADPNPAINLPDAEYVEIKNISGNPINLSGWRLRTSTSTSGAFPSYTLPADSFLILVTSSQVANFVSFGRVIAVPSFPAIPNDGSMLSIAAPNGNNLHAVEYSTEWYGNEAKKNGGWSLEMIDSQNPCAGMNNWKASVDASGGSPGKKNSVDGVNPDNEAPRLLRSYSTDSLTIVLVFDEPLNIPSASIASQFSISNGLGFISAIPLSPLFNAVVLTLNAPMQRRVVYEVTTNNVKDCKGNTIGAYNKSKAGWGEDAVMNDIVINEILFNPRPNAEDFLELYNRSNKVLDANKLFIANRNSAGAISSLKKISETSYNIYPGEFIVLTGNIASLQREYHVKQPSLLIPLSLPSYPNDKGVAVILNLQGEVVDELNYDEDWHFKLISNYEGISLERIDSEAPTQSADNWHSAASTSGYATPTYQNSQYKQINVVDATLEVSPKVFSPDNDGYDDVATISYKLNEPGYVANVTIFDASGRPVRNLVRNGTMGLSGMWRWDGLGEKNQKLPIGNYIIYTEIFNLQEKKQQFKNVIVLARKLN